MRRLAQLRFLEVGVDPDLGERADRHQALARHHVVARIHVAAGDDAVDLGQHVAVAKIQFGLIEIALRLQQLGLGLLDGRRILQNLFVDAIDLALRIALVKLGDHFRRRHVERLVHAQLRGRLHQAGLRLLDRGERLIQIVGHLGQIVARLGAQGQAQRDANLVDSFQGLFEPRLRDQQRLLAEVKLLPRQRLRCISGLARSKSACAGERGLLRLERRHARSQHRDLIVHVLDRRVQD